jgi:Tfp pilus assembly protein PilZ
MLHARTVALKQIHAATRVISSSAPGDSRRIEGWHVHGVLAPAVLALPMSESRRLHERYEVELPVMLLHDGVEIPASTVNISLGGVLVRTERRIAFGANLLVRIELPALSEPAELAGVVRWDRDGQIGVQFSALRAKDTWALNQLMKR